MRQVVIQLARVGDVAQSLPLCRILRQRGPLTLVLSVDPGSAMRSEADEVVVLDLPHLASLRDRPHRLFRVVQEAFAEHASLWQEEAAIYCLNADPLAQALSQLFPAIQRSGAGYPATAYHQWLHLLPTHRRENRIHLCSAMASLGSSKPPPLWPARLPGEGPILLHPGSGSLARQLPVTFWRELVRHLLPLGRSILLSGGSHEIPLCKDILNAFPACGSLRSLCGETTLDQLIEVLDSAALLIAQDTGVLHLGAWRGTPVLGLYHASAWAWETAPWQEGALVFQSIRDCGPCLEGAPSCGDFPCRTDFQAPEVAHVATARLNGRDVQRPSSIGCALLRMCRGETAPELRELPAPKVDEEQIRTQLAMLMGKWEHAELLPGREQRLLEAVEDGMGLGAWRRREWPRPASGLRESWSWMRETVLLRQP